MRRISIGVAAFILISFCGNAQVTTGKTYTLKQCIETAIANNLDVRQSALAMQVGQVNWQQAKLNLLPDLNGSIGHGINQGRSIDPFTNGYINEQVNFADYNLTSGVILFNGFSLLNAIRQNSLAYQASKMDWQQAKDNITLNVILNYLLVLTNEDQLVQLKNQAELSGKQVERLNVLNQNGSIRPSDLYDVKGQLASDQLSVIATQNNLEGAKISLSQLMNIPYDREMKIERLDADALVAQYANEPGQIYKTALEQFALVKAAEFRTKSAASAVKVYRGQLFPTLSFNAGGRSNYSSAASQNTFINTTDKTTSSYVLINGSPSFVIAKQDNFRADKITYGRQLNNNLSNYFSLNLNIPIFNSLQARNRLKLGRIEAKRVELVEQTTKTQLQQDIERAYLNMTAAFDRYKTLLDQVNAYTESFKAAETRFNEGVGTSIDYLIAKNRLDAANINLILARYDYVLRTRILDYYQGKAGW